MKHLKRWLTLWWMAAVAVFIAMTFIAATYAWFTANREVQTDKVSAKTGSSELELQVSRTGGSGFNPERDASGNGQVTLKASANPLLPVSTADLQSFVYCPVTDNGIAKTFLLAEDETLYYHDTIYLRAIAENVTENTQIALYLDNTDIPIVKDEGGELLTAARLGLKINGGNPVIFRLSDVNTGESNTMLSGVPLGANKVLTWLNGAVAVADDPAISIAERQISTSGAATVKPIAYLTLNQVYTVDIYFYLEGCDPECTHQQVARDEGYLELAFFGLLTEEGAS